LGDSDDDGDDLSYPSKPINGNSALDYPSRETQRKHDIPVRPLHYVHTIDDDDEDPDEELDPALAALAAKARARAAASARTAINPVNGEPEKSPVVQLLVNPQIPDSNALMVKVRTDHTLEKTRLAWCGKQGYSPAATQDVFFTWKGARVFDSTTIRRLGIEVDSNGNVSVEGDSNIYDDTNLPKVYVEAWTQALFDEHKKEEAADAAAKRKALEPSPEIEEREPTPEPAPKEKKFRLIMKARGKAEFKIQVHPVRHGPSTLLLSCIDMCATRKPHLDILRLPTRRAAASKSHNPSHSCSMARGCLLWMPLSTRKSRIWIPSTCFSSKRTFESLYLIAGSAMLAVLYGNFIVGLIQVAAPVLQVPSPWARHPLGVPLRSPPSPDRQRPTAVRRVRPAR
jgi:hypothetical protein